MVILGIVFMTYHVESLSLRKKQVNKSGDFAFKKALIQYSGYFRVAKAIWDIQTTRLSLCTGSGESRPDVTNPGAKGCFYGQAPISLVKSLRELARASGQSISDITAHALERVLTHGEEHG